MMLPSTLVNLYPRESGRVTAQEEMTMYLSTPFSRQALATFSTPMQSTFSALPPLEEAEEAKMTAPASFTAGPSVSYLVTSTPFTMSTSSIATSVSPNIDPSNLPRVAARTPYPPLATREMVQSFPVLPLAPMTTTGRLEVPILPFSAKAGREGRIEAAAAPPSSALLLIPPSCCCCMLRLERVALAREEEERGRLAERRAEGVTEGAKAEAAGSAAARRRSTELIIFRETRSSLNAFSLSVC
mmetsp:Transcript_33329/g.81239  ORF Transcript_33329/g.81239 Transcript_33329/m.81239 type:complete len:243 (+) Transcript_33329:516-1244(+)